MKIVAPLTFNSFYRIDLQRLQKKESAFLRHSLWESGTTFNAHALEDSDLVQFPRCSGLMMLGARFNTTHRNYGGFDNAVF